jgi:hypothetical protein
MQSSSFAEYISIPEISYLSMKTPFYGQPRFNSFSKGISAQVRNFEGTRLQPKSATLELAQLSIGP